MSYVAILLLRLLVLLLAAGCGGGGGGEAGGPNTQSLSLSTGDVKQIATSNSQASVILETPGGEEYLHIVYTTTTQSGAHPFTLSSSAPSMVKRVPLVAVERERGYAEARLQFDHFLRGEERRMIEEGLLPSGAGIGRLFTLFKVQPGEQETFFILDPRTRVFRQRTATARTIRPHSVLFLDDAVILTPTLEGQIEQMVEDFETIIHPRSEQLFGEESDVNNDGRITILVTSLLNGTGVAGFFLPSDLFLRDTDNPFSNEQEILYVALPSSSLPLGLIEATMAHEFQHLINFQQKVLRRIDQGLPNPPSEDLWLNEALSHLAEDLTGFSEDGDDLVNIVEDYLEQVEFFSLADNDAFGGSDTLQRRGAGYLFLRYLFEQAGGATYSSTDPAGITDRGGITFLRQLESSSHIGIDNIRTALRTVTNPFQQASDPFQQAFAHWAVALFMDGTRLNTDPRFHFQAPEFDQITGQRRGIDLRGTREGRSGLVTLRGPHLQFFNSHREAVQSTGVAYILFQASPQGEDTTTITLRGNAESRLQLTVVRTE
ncbi:MAG: hypothetical protein D6736_10310 [Nitrospinota bacterium]|nr:MAG: hypothetical protein D6736_10310 [Nitrospinota bacterium]